MGRVARRGVLLGVPGLALALVGCGAGDPVYYTLAVWPGTVLRAAPSPIEVRAPSVAAFLDRDYIVQSTKDYRLELAGNDAWAEPIGDMIARVLTSDLAQRLPGSTVFKAGTAIGGAAVAIVELVIDRFDEDGSGLASVSATLVVRQAEGGPGVGVPIVLTDRPASRATSDLVASLSRMLGGVADQAASRLAAMAVTPLASG